MPRPILIIEDDPDIAEVLRYNLESRKFETRVARNGKEGLAASADKQQPPLLILPHQLLLEMNGLDICRHICRDSTAQHVPIIMMTTKSSTEDFPNVKGRVDDYVDGSSRSNTARTLRIRSLLNSF